MHGSTGTSIENDVLEQQFACLELGVVFLVHPSPVKIHSDKTGKLLPLDDKQLLNRHSLLHFEEDGSGHRSKIFGVECEFQDPRS